MKVSEMQINTLQTVYKLRTLKWDFAYIYIFRFNLKHNLSELCQSLLLVIMYYDLNIA